ncbi:hypothetical protein EB796_018745 [Bugula neritina]|uniref:C-type lectin domain-containing protein n=1 Tax=Bugula neritina TaxID=10212 RepID=A0A7J7JC61_BUGNE|nr:hypothetical protein EB796_018745 [Bugula neritina]
MTLFNKTAASLRELKRRQHCTRKVPIRRKWIILTKLNKTSKKKELLKKQEPVQQQKISTEQEALDEQTVKAQKRQVDVVIVEEHHGVLPYWFELANQSKETTRNESKSKHPSYTLAAIGTGLVDRFVWVWPSWTNKTSYVFGNHTTGLVDLGLFNYTEQNKVTTGMCICMKETYTDGVRSKPFTDPLGRTCLYAKPELVPYEGKDAECYVKVENIRFDYVKDTYMEQNSRNILQGNKPKLAGDNKKKLSPIILDIDEDYFGCEEVSDSLLEAGINWTHIEKINEMLRPLFCPRTADEEKHLSDLITSVMQSNCTSLLEINCLTLTHENTAAMSPTKCSTACISSGWQCQSFNFFRHSQTCELKACNTLKAGTLFALSNNSLSSYYEVKESTFPGCKTSHDIDTCKSAATLSCTPGSDVYGRTCLCHDWASGDDCSERTDICTPEGICYEMTSAANLASANSHCNSISGNLLTIDYPLSLQDHLRSYLTFLTNQDILIGIEYNSVYQDFAYTGNKQPLTGYTNWLEEKNATERRGCVKLSYVDDYKWVDVDCSTELPSICVVPTCQASFTKYNGSCYYINGSLRSWDEQLNFCNSLAEDSRVALPKFKEEDDMLINLFTQNFDNSYPVTLGLSDYTSSQTFSSVVTDWIVLDMHMKWSTWVAMTTAWWR